MQELKNAWNSTKNAATGADLENLQHNKHVHVHCITDWIWLSNLQSKPSISEIMSIVIFRYIAADVT